RGCRAFRWSGPDARRPDGGSKGAAQASALGRGRLCAATPRLSLSTGRLRRSVGLGTASGGVGAGGGQTRIGHMTQEPSLVFVVRECSPGPAAGGADSDGVSMEIRHPTVKPESHPRCRELVGRPSPRPGPLVNLPPAWGVRSWSRRAPHVFCDVMIATDQVGSG